MANTTAQNSLSSSAECCNTPHTESTLHDMRRRDISSVRESPNTDGAQLHSRVLARVHAGAHVADTGVRVAPSSSAKCCVDTSHTESTLHDMRRRNISSARRKPDTDGAQLHLRIVVLAHVRAGAHVANVSALTSPQWSCGVKSTAAAVNPLPSPCRVVRFTTGVYFEKLSLTKHSHGKAW